MLKRGTYIITFFVLALIVLPSFAVAQNENESASEDKIEQAYSCLKSQIANKTTLGLPDATFSLLAIGPMPKIMQKIEEEKKEDSSGICWPKAGCKIKETAQIGLAFERGGQNREQIKRWILAKNSTASELNWYLQIDILNAEAATCTITRGKETPGKINIGEDMRITGSPGTCFSIFENYKLKANSACLNSEFEIACNKDFATATLYQKRAGGAFFVSSDTKSASGSPAFDTKVTQKFNSKCFGTTSSCDYEGSLWATIFLRGIGEDVSPYLPYLLAFAEDNPKYFPYAFLHILVSGDEQYDSVVKLQKTSKANEGYWEMIGSPYGRYYDTSLGMLSLISKSSTELDNARNYLLSVQGKSGCWNNNNIRDTAFVLYSGWPRETAGPVDGGTTYCSAPYSCENAQDCTDGGGLIIHEAECLTFGEVCCSIAIAEKTCAEKGGKICTTYEGCAGDEVSSRDGKCCLGDCVQKVLPPAGECEEAGGVCRYSCYDDEMEGVEYCTENKICCLPKEEKKGSAWFWIILLLILIALVVLAIIFRDKVRLWWHKFKEKFRKKPSAPGAPAAAGRMPPRPIMPMQRPGMYGMQRPMAVQRAMPPKIMSARDKEMEETLKKLREIGK
ncbi:MAG: hypothetical protein QXD13_00325 [Candidatus Pacearchaeota archaeon]